MSYKRALVQCLLALALFASVPPNAFAQSPANLEQIARELESALHQGQLRLSAEQRNSLLSAAAIYVPELAVYPRIAGTDEAIADNGASGYYGGVYFGPIVVNDRRLDYVKMTIWGNSELGWTFDHLARHTAVQRQDHPMWLWLEAPVTEEQAMEVIRQLRAMAQTGSPPLSQYELDHLHRFSQRFEPPSDLEGPEAVRWYSKLPIVAGYSQLASSRRYEYFVAANFAVVNGDLAFIDVRRKN